MFDNLRGFFEIGIVVLFLISTVAYIIYRLWFAKQMKQALASNLATASSLPRKERKAIKHNTIDSQLTSMPKKTVYFFADLFWVLFIVVGVRSFVFEPFIIPSESMRPGLLIGDIVLVNKSSYGIRLPVISKKITSGKGVKRGDVAVFKYPVNPETSYIKRIIGVPGDTIHYDNRTLTVNGQKIDIKKLRQEDDEKLGQVTGSYDVYEENLLGLKHEMRYNQRGHRNFGVTELTVPKGNYFVMGDNRDNSSDGRAFKFVPDDNMIGRASRILMNLQCLKGAGYCDRFFKKIN